MSEVVAYRYRYKDALTWVHSTTEPARHPNLIVEPLCVAKNVVAHEMLEALKDVVVAFGMNNAEPHFMVKALEHPISRAIDAIALAEGRQTADAKCDSCNGSGLQFVDAGNGNINEDQCWTCGGTGKPVRVRHA